MLLAKQYRYNNIVSNELVNFCLAIDAVSQRLTECTPVPCIKAVRKSPVSSKRQNLFAIKLAILCRPSFRVVIGDVFAPFCYYLFIMQEHVELSVNITGCR